MTAATRPPSGGRSRLLRALRWVGGLLAVVGLLFVGLGLSPKTQPLADDVSIVEAGATSVDAEALRPYSARYSTWSRVLGVPVKKGSIDVTLDRTAEGVSVSFDFGGGFSDQMLLDGNTLAPIRRGFPGQAFAYEGDQVRAELGSDGDAPDIRTFEFPGSVFEPSVLDLIVAAGAELPARVAWSNFADPTEWLAHVREIGTETIQTAGGDTFDTRIVDIGFADGTIRRYWLAASPPYKIKQRTFERGRSIVSAWDLVQLQPR